ncbi:MAG: nucleotidyl transferase AbiEii/AbiGii toxin family protein [Chloroflexi bacterium]|nr:nucleotidyl transferase AbiEii/AbiGii toxin family protein [Chloroflexota bacterium]
MNGTLESFASFLALPDQDKRDVFEAAASRIDTLPSYVEKDLWVCLVLEALYNRLPDGHPRLFFKGGTSLSKACGLIRRFSEDIDLVVSRDDLGFAGASDPTVSAGLSKNKREALFDQLGVACSEYVLGDLATELATLMNHTVEGCRVSPDEDDNDRQTLLIEYPTQYRSSEGAYVAPRVKIEAGARSALDPTLDCAVTPLVADELHDWSLEVGSIRVIAPERTYW